MARGVLACVGLAIVLLPLTAPAEEAAVDEFELLQQLRQQYREGLYEEAVSTGQGILESGPSTLVRAEAHQYIGASAELLGETEMAEEQFEELLTLQPAFRIERAEFPTEVLSLFDTAGPGIEDTVDSIRRRFGDDALRRARALDHD
jgi:tetratricopeptide (TPR) repeat protein